MLHYINKKQIRKQCEYIYTHYFILFYRIYHSEFYLVCMPSLTPRVSFRNDNRISPSVRIIYSFFAEFTLKLRI